MKIHIPEQTFELDEGGYGRLRFELAKEETMDEQTASPTADTAAPVEVASPEAEVVSDAGVQAPVEEEVIAAEPPAAAEVAG